MAVIFNGMEWINGVYPRTQGVKRALFSRICAAEVGAVWMPDET